MGRISHGDDSDGEGEGDEGKDPQEFFTGGEKRCVAGSAHRKGEEGDFHRADAPHFRFYRGHAVGFRCRTPMREWGARRGI